MLYVLYCLFQGLYTKTFTIIKRWYIRFVPAAICQISTCKLVLLKTQKNSMVGLSLVFMMRCQIGLGGSWSNGIATIWRC